MLDRILSLSPWDLVAAAFSSPLFSLFIALLITPVAIVVARRVGNRRRLPSAAAADTATIVERYRPERLAVAIGAALVLVAFVVEVVLRGYVLPLVDVVEWWAYAAPVFAAFLSISVVVALIVTRGSARPEQPMLSPERRTWRSFSSRGALAGIGLTAATLLVTTIAAGLTSSSDANGRFIHLDLVVLNQPVDPVRPWFYGWAYGVPVLICVAVLVAVTWVALHRNAVRPFRRQSTVESERMSRAEVASGVVRIATAGMLLALAGAWRFIDRAGSIGRLIIEGEAGGTYETTWKYAEFADAGGALAPALEVTAFLLLILAATRMLRAKRPRVAAEPVEAAARPADVEALR